MMLAYFGIESSGLNLAIDLLILFVAVLYFALIYWTYADARRRIYDPMLVGCATAAALLFPYVGVIVYIILRPPEYLEDVRERELEMQAAEARLHDLDHGLCPHCDYRVERDFIRCPSCLRKLKERCVSCARPLDQAWTICPYCETEVAAAAPTRRPRRRRTAAESDPSEIGRPAAEKGRSGTKTADDWLGESTAEGGAVLAEDGEDTASAVEPVAASEPAARSRGTGRASRPRPTS